MVEILYVNHSWSMLKSTNFQLLRKIKYHFSIEYKNAFYMMRNNPNFSGKMHFITDKNTFPSGLLSKVVTFLIEEKIEFKINDYKQLRKRILPKQFDFDYKLKHAKLGEITLYDYQQEGVKRALYYGRGITNVATNGGKTEILISIIKNLLKAQPDFVILLVVPNIQLLKDTGDRVQYGLNMACNIYHNKNRSLKQVNITTIQTLHSENKKVKKEHWKNIDCVLIDELHAVSGSKGWYGLIQNMFVNAKMRIGMTGTTKVDDAVREMQFEALVGPIIHKITNAQLIDRGQSSKPTVHIWRIHISTINSKLSYPDEVKHVFGSSEFLREFVTGFKTRDNKNEGGNLILVSNIDHGKILEKYLPDAIFLSGKHKVSTRNQTLKAWGNGKYKTIIATKIFQFGLDTKHIKRLYILYLSKKTSTVLQQIGRGLRKNELGKVDIYFLKFTGTNHLEMFANTQARLCRKEGFEVLQE